VLAQPGAGARLAALRAAGVGILFDDARPGDEDLIQVQRDGLLAVKLDHDRAGDLVGAAGHARPRPVVALARGLGLAVVAEGSAAEAQRTGARPGVCARPGQSLRAAARGADAGHAAGAALTAGRPTPVMLWLTQREPAAGRGIGASGDRCGGQGRGRESRRHIPRRFSTIR